MKIGILAVQGAFVEHEKILERLNHTTFEIRKREDLERDMAGLILPGGESTAMGKILEDLKMLDPLKKMIDAGLPVLGTCAGMILLAENITGQEKTYLATLPIKVQRNAYGRQLGSFTTEADIKHVGKIPLRFIRAPYVQSVTQDVEVLGTVEQRIIAVKYKNQLALAFHPELTQNDQIHQYFLEMIKNRTS